MSKATPQFMPHVCACIHVQSHLKCWRVSDNILCVVFQDRRTALMLAARVNICCVRARLVRLSGVINMGFSIDSFSIFHTTALPPGHNHHTPCSWFGWDYYGYVSTYLLIWWNLWHVHWVLWLNSQALHTTSNGNVGLGTTRYNTSDITCWQCTS